MITAEELKANGYSNFSAGGWRGTTSVWQKSIRNNKGERLYFIDFLYYPPPNNFGVSVQFNTHKTTKANPCFSVDILIDEDTTIAQVERFYRRMYKQMKCYPYGD